MLWLCEQRFVIILVQKPLLLHATASLSAQNHGASLAKQQLGHKLGAAFVEGALEGREQGARKEGGGRNFQLDITSLQPLLSQIWADGASAIRKQTQP